MNEGRTKQLIDGCLAERTLRGQTEAIAIAIHSLKNLEGKYFVPSFGSVELDLHCCEQLAKMLLGEREMNERIKELAEQVWGDTSGKPWSASAIAHLERFAELVRQDEREQWDTSDMAYRPNGLAIDDDDIQEYKKPWVGLTDEEIAQTVGSPLDEVYLADFRRFEAKLRERNT